MTERCPAQGRVTIFFYLACIFLIWSFLRTTCMDRFYYYEDHLSEVFLGSTKIKKLTQWLSAAPDSAESLKLSTRIHQKLFLLLFPLDFLLFNLIYFYLFLLKLTQGWKKKSLGIKKVKLNMFIYAFWSWHCRSDEHKWNLIETIDQFTHLHFSLCFMNLQRSTTSKHQTLWNIKNMQI